MPLELEVVRSVSRLAYYRPKEAPFAVALLQALVANIGFSLDESYVAEVLGAVIHLLHIDASGDRS